MKSFAGLVTSPSSRFVPLASAICAAALFAVIPTARAQHYLQTNLVSDVPGWAAATDPNLVNAWGLSRSATSPWWVADNGTGLSTLYTGTGTVLGLVVTVPAAMAPAAPTGTAFNATTDFPVAPGKPARFLFVTEEGTISGWNPTVDGTHAITVVDHSGWAIYKGMALGLRGTANFLYAANFHGGTVEVYDGNFQPVNLGANAFRDWRLPKGYAPFNVQNINGNIAVAFAQQDADKMDEVPGPGKGYVDIFNTDGVLLLRLEHGRYFNAPWGLVQAPAGFGKFSGMLLVGQFGSGKIAAFEPAHGHFRGFLRAQHGKPLMIDGLWALSFGNGAGAGPATTLYFSAGPADESHGLFGSVTAIVDTEPDHDGDDD